MNVPFVDLNAQYLTIKSAIDSAIERTIANSDFIGGQDVRDFEAEFANYCETKACVGVRNGRGAEALHLALQALAIGPGDEVITVAHTFIATAEAICLAGARPVFVDIRKDTMLMDPDALESVITPQTRAIIPVHLYGQCCDMDRIMEVANRHGLKVIEEAAQAHGARWRGRRAGSMGDAACFSFSSGKNLGAYGDPGAVVSHDESLIHRIRMLANHGRTGKNVRETEGANSGLDGLEAAILRIKLRYLDGWNAARQRHSAQYFRMLSNSEVTIPVVDPRADPVWHLFVVRVSERDVLQKSLRGRGIATGIHYPVPLHLQPAYSRLGIPAGTLPVTEWTASHVLSLPMYPELTPDQIDTVSQTVTEITLPQNICAF